MLFRTRVYSNRSRFRDGGWAHGLSGKHGGEGDNNTAGPWTSENSTHIERERDESSPQHEDDINIQIYFVALG